MRKLPTWDISITIAENGVMVRIGCKSFVSEDIDKAMREIASFIKDEKTEFSKKYLLDENPICGVDQAATPQPLRQ